MLTAEGQEWRKTAKNGKNRSNLAQILRKLQIFGVTAGAAKNCGNGKNRSKFTAIMLTFGVRFPKLSLKFSSSNIKEVTDV